MYHNVTHAATSSVRDEAKVESADMLMNEHRLIERALDAMRGVDHDIGVRECMQNGAELNLGRFVHRPPVERPDLRDRR